MAQAPVGECYTEDPLSPPPVGGGLCDETIFYAPIDPAETPIKTIRIALHVFKNSDGEENFQDTPADRALLMSIVYGTTGMNYDLANNLTASHIDPMCPGTFIQDTRLRISLQEDDIFFYDDTNAWSPQSNNDRHNIYDFYIGSEPNFDPYLRDHAIHILIVNNVNGNTTFGSVADFLHNGGQYFMTKGIYSNPTVIPTEAGRNWIHEIGHLLGLSHTENNDGCCDTYEGFDGETNNVMDHGSTQRHLSECQLGRMHYYFSGLSSVTDLPNTNTTDYCTADINQPDVIISTGELITWEAQKRLTSNVTVETGGELIVKCDVGLPDDGLITVQKGARIKVDGGRITHNKTISQSCDVGKWDQILLVGNNLKNYPNMLDDNYLLAPGDPAIAIIKNGGTVEHSWNGISCTKGAMVAGYNSFFYDNVHQSINIKNGKANYSHFVNCDFIDFDDLSERGIKLENVNLNDEYNILLNNCQLQGMSLRGLEANDAMYYTVFTRFWNNLHGIRTFSSAPLASQGILAAQNDFRDNVAGAYFSGFGYLQAINNNYFDNNNFGIAFTGGGNFIIRDNYFTNDLIGLDFEQTGNNFNNISACNVFEDEFRGIKVEGDNLGYKFDHEEFRCEYDLHLKEYSVGGFVFPGKLPDHGATGSATWNFFSNHLQNELNIYTSGSTDFFDYYYSDMHPTYPRLKPKCAYNYPPSNNCFVAQSYNAIETDGGEGDCLLVLAGLNSGFAENNGAESNSQGAENNGNVNIAEALEELETPSLENTDALWSSVWEYAADENFSAAEELLSSQNTTSSRRSVFGLKLMAEDFAAATAYLQNMPVTNEDDAYFKQVQEINLSYRQDPDSFTPTDADYATLNEISATGLPAAFMAQSLLAILYGQEFEPRMPEEVEDRSISSEKGHNESPNSLLISPNPVDAIAVLNIKIDLTQETGVKINIMSPSGTQIRELTLRGSSELLDTSTLPDGLYFIQIRTDKRVIATSRLVVQH